MGCCVSKDSGQRGHRRRSPAKPPPPLPPSYKTHLPELRSPFPPPPEEETVVKQVLSETPLPRRSSPEVGEAGEKRKIRVEDEAPETKILISRLEEAAEIVSGYSEMCSAGSGSLSTATTAAAGNRDYEVTTGGNRDFRRRQRLNTGSGGGRSPVKVPGKRPSAGGARMLRPEDEAREEAATSEYSEMCSAASGSLSTATTTATDHRDHEVTSRDRRDLRRQQRVNTGGGSSRSPVKPPSKRSSTAGGVRPSHSQSQSPARRPQVARPESRGEQRRDFSGELRARQRNVGPAAAGRGSAGGSRRSSRSPAPAARRNIGKNEPGGAARVPPAGPEIVGGRPLEVGGAKEEMGGERRQKAAAAKEEEEEERDVAAVSEQGNESLVDNPHVSLECFIFL